MHLDEAKAREQRVLFSARRIDREIREERAALKESFKRVERIHSDLSTPAITDLVEKRAEIDVHPPAPAPAAPSRGLSRREYIGIKPHRPKKSITVATRMGGPQLDGGGVFAAIWAGEEMASCRVSLQRGKFLKACWATYKRFEIS